MQITCPLCRYSRDVPPEKLPSRQVTVTCPGCRQSFTYTPGVNPPLDAPATAGGLPQHPAPAPEMPSLAVPHPAGPGPQAAARSSRSWATIDLKSLAPRHKAAVAGFVILVFCLVGLRLWADGRARAVPFPNMIAPYAGQVAVSWGQHILVYDTAGVLTADLPMPPETELTHLCYDTEGDLWLGDHRTKQILRRQDGQWKAVINGAGTILGTFKFVHYPPTGEIFVTDSSNHRILVYSAGGRFLRSFAREGKAPGELKFPNEIALLDGDLLVVNTNAGRLDLFSPDGKFIKTFVNSEKNGCYIFPTLFTWLDGGGFAYLLTVDLRDAKSVAHGPDGLKKGEFTPPWPLRDVGDIAFAGGKVIVSDIGTRRVHTFDAATLEYLGPLNLDLAKRARAAGKEEAYYEAIARWSLILLLAPCIWVAVVFVRFQRQQAAQTPLAVTQVPADVIWGVPTDRRQFLPMALSGSITLILYLWNGAAFAHPAQARPYAAAGVVAALACFVFFFRALMASGLINIARTGHVRQLLQDAWQKVSAALADGERIVGCTAVRKSQLVKESVLLVLTGRRLLIVGFERDLLRETAHDIASLPYGQIADVQIAPTKLTSGWAARLFKAEEFGLTIGVLAGTQRSTMMFIGMDRAILERVKGALESSRAEAEPLAVSAAAIASVKPPVHHVRPAGSWKAMILSALYPGLGQFHNRQIVKGAVFAALFTIQVVLLTRPAVQLLNRSAELRMQDIPILAGAFGTLLLWWLIAVADAWRTAKNRTA